MELNLFKKTNINKLKMLKTSKRTLNVKGYFYCKNRHNFHTLVRIINLNISLHGILGIPIPKINLLNTDKCTNTWSKQEFDKLWKHNRFYRSSSLWISHSQSWRMIPNSSAVRSRTAPAGLQKPEGLQDEGIWDDIETVHITWKECKWSLIDRWSVCLLHSNH